MFENPRATAERRVATRVNYRMDLTDAKGRFVGCTLDLSASGMRVLCAPEADIVSHDRLHIVLPTWLGQGPGLEVLGHFVWCKAGGARGTEAGFAFEGMKDKAQRALCQVVEQLERTAEEDA